MSAFWSWYIIVLVVANIVGVVWLLFVTAKQKQSKEGVGTTGHVWDGDLQELNHPLPLWWLGLFVISVIFGGFYLAFYPGLGATKGMLGWTSNKELAAELAENNRKLETVFAHFRNESIEQLEKDTQALTLGHNVFVNNCAACHGSDARGAKGYPNLTDDDWLYGGTPDNVVATIAKGRNGVMPPLGAALGDQGVDEVANYVLSLSGQKADSTLADAGKARYATICIACHGPEGKGNPVIGAPNLTDKIWLYGGTLDDIKASIKNGRGGHMPAWETVLGPDRVRLAAAWVLAQSPHANVDAAAAPAPVASGEAKP